jgi:hypothetical protein
MGKKSMFVIRIQISCCELDFCESGHYDDFPMVSDFVTSVLNLTVSSKLDGPSERVWSFQNSTLLLLNNPSGTTLRASNWDDLALLHKLVEQYLKNLLGQRLKISDVPK